MRILVIVFVLAGCATQRPQPYMTLAQIQAIQLAQTDCPRYEEIVDKLEQQQIRAGIPRINPEVLPPTAREYQSEIRKRVWALRIGCNNPDRYN